MVNDIDPCRNHGHCYAPVIMLQHAVFDIGIIWHLVLANSCDQQVIAARYEGIFHNF